MTRDDTLNAARIDVCSHPDARIAMSGDIREALDERQAVGIFLDAENSAAFPADIPATEWQVSVVERPWGSRNLTLLLPEEHSGVAYIRPYRPVPPRDRAHLARQDWSDAEPSPNPGLLAYHVSNRITVVTLPMMSKERARHNFYRHLFVELSDAPAWRHPLRHHNNPGITITEERQMVKELRHAVRGDVATQNLPAG